MSKIISFSTKFRVKRARFVGCKFISFLLGSKTVPQSYQLFIKAFKQKYPLLGLMKLILQGKTLLMNVIFEFERSHESRRKNIFLAVFLDCDPCFNP